MLPASLDDRPIARVWHGVVPIEKADRYEDYLVHSELGVRAYRAIPGNRGATLLRRAEGKRVHFLLISFWESEEAIRDYAGSDIERARYFRYDLECLIEPEKTADHYEVVVDSRDAAPQPASGTTPIERALQLAVPSGLW